MENEQLFDALLRAERAAIFMHIRPDGDTIGSGLGLARGLRLLGKQVDAYCDDDMRAKFGFLDGYDQINKPVLSAYDVLIAVDCSDCERMGGYGENFVRAKNTVCIDHHRSNTNFAKYNLVHSNASATCEIMLSVLKTLGVTLDREIAECLYTGISTDTGNFSHSNTTAEVFAAANELMQYGVDVHKITSLVYRNSSRERIRLLGKTLSGMKFYEKNTVAVELVTLHDLADCGAGAGETEGFIDYAIGIEGVEVALCLLQHGANSYKVSFRSKGKADVCAAASMFGGGGHTLASGCQLSGDYYEVLERLLKAVKDELYE